MPDAGGPIQQLLQEFAKLPGIGPKTAEAVRSSSSTSRVQRSDRADSTTNDRSAGRSPA